MSNRIILSLEGKKERIIDKIQNPFIFFNGFENNFIFIE